MGMRDCWLRGAAIRPCSLFFPTPVSNHSDIEEWSLALILLHSTSAAIPSFYRATELGRGSFLSGEDLIRVGFHCWMGCFDAKHRPAKGLGSGVPSPMIF